MLLCTLLLLIGPSLALQEHDESREVMQETLKLMLDFNKIPTVERSQPLRTVSKQTTSYMKRLYKSLAAVNEENADGNVVRGLDPAVGKVEGQEVLVFDISGIGEEQIMRAELHFHLRKKGMPGKRARALSARALCVNEYCTESQYLHHIASPSGVVVWDATKALVESHALGGRQLIVRVSRRDVKMRSYSEMIRKSSPFLLVFSKADNVLDGDRVRREVEGARRRRRETDGYYTYHGEGSDSGSEKISSTSSSPLSKYRNKGISVLTPIGDKLPAFRPKKTKIDDIWDGFGDETDDSDEDDEAETAAPLVSNDVKVVLLGDDKKKVCALKSMRIDFADLGWEDYVMAPKYFEAGRCEGTCRLPLSKSGKPSNHAILQSLLLPKVPACCAPDEMGFANIMFNNDDGYTVTIKRFEKMIVKSCACL